MTSNAALAPSVSERPENWGFTPFGKRDLDVYAQELQLVFDRRWFMVAETPDGDTAAVAITVIDVNQVLKKMNGRLLPLGWWHFLRRSRYIGEPRTHLQHVATATAINLSR